MAIYTERIVLNSYGYYQDWTLKAGDVYVGATSNQQGAALNTSFCQYAIITDSSEVGSEEYTFFTGNSSSTYGGAISIVNCTKQSEIKKTIFLGNKGLGGSAVYVANESILTIEDSIFEGNTAKDGGALSTAGAVHVKNTQFLNNISDGTGDAQPKTYAAGAIYVSGGKVTLEDCYFYGNTSSLSTDSSMPGRVSGAVAIYPGGTLVLKGENILATETDTIYVGWTRDYGKGRIVFDVSENTTSESAARAILNNYDNINGISSTNLASVVSFNIGADQRSDVYLIAQNASKITEIVPPGVSGTDLYVTLDSAHSTSITVNAAELKEIGDTGVKVALKTTENNDLLLVVGDSFVFVNNEYKSEEESVRTAIYRGAPFKGEADKRHFDKFSAGVAKAKEINGKLVGVDTGVVSYSVPLKGVTAELTSGTFSKQVFGGAIFTSGSLKAETGSDLTITGGTYRSNVIGGDFAKGAKVEQSKACNLFISDGIFDAAIAAGGFVSNTTAGSKVTVASDVNLTISGGIFNGRVYGGNYATNDNAKAADSNISGDIDILVKVGGEKIAFNDGLAAGSRGTGAIDGNVKVTFTGIVENSKNDNSNLIFGDGAKVWGGSNMDKIIISGEGEYKVNSSVAGDRLLSFKNFKDDAFEAKVAMFKSIEAIGSSQVTFACAELDTTIVENWTLGGGCSLAGLVKNDFTGDTLNLNYNGDASLVVLSGGAGSLKGWNDETTTVFLNGEKAEWTAAGNAVDGGFWGVNGIRLYREDNGLKLASY